MGNEPLSRNLFNILAKWTHTGDKSTVQTLILGNGISSLYAWTREEAGLRREFEWRVCDNKSLKHWTRWKWWRLADKSSLHEQDTEEEDTRGCRPGEPREGAHDETRVMQGPGEGQPGARA